MLICPQLRASVAPVASACSVLPLDSCTSNRLTSLLPWLSVTFSVQPSYHPVCPPPITPTSFPDFPPSLYALLFCVTTLLLICHSRLGSRRHEDTHGVCFQLSPQCPVPTLMPGICQPPKGNGPGDSGALFKAGRSRQTQILALSPSLLLFSFSVTEQGLIVGPFWRVPQQHGVFEGSDLYAGVQTAARSTPLSPSYSRRGGV